MTEETAFEKMLIILTWILGAITIYWLILKLTGHSPTAMQIMMSIGGFMSGLVMYHQQKIGQLDEFKHYTEKEFTKVHQKLDKLDAQAVASREDIMYIKARIEKM